MFNRKFIICVYKLVSTFYVFLFGRKKMQFLNNIVFSLSLDAKGYKNYGNFSETGEKTFLNLIRNEINLSLDIGANTGKYTELLLTQSKTKVIAFEPMSESFKELKKIKLRFNERLEIYNIALGEENISKKIFFGNNKSEKASLVENLDKLSFIRNINKNSQIVDVKKLDALENIFENKLIDFIKIDTEGYEFEVLTGAKKILEKHKPKFIQIEFNWHQLIKNQNLYNLSNLVSFSDVFRILPFNNGLIHIDPSRPENNIYHLSNYVFIRKDISKNYK